MNILLIQPYFVLSNSLQTAQGGAAPVVSPTRGVFGGGVITVVQNIIDYITIATTGNATDFGDLTVSRVSIGACNSSTRGICAAGDTNTVGSNVIDYITIATTGNATDFGDVTITRSGLAGVNSDTRGCFGGGYTSSSVDIIDYITIATTGNAIDFGDLSVARYDCAGVQNGL